MTDSTGVYIGRFQPFHNGHKEVIDYLLQKVDFLYIVVGSSNRSYEPRNPFTAGERIRMLREWMEEDTNADYLVKHTMILPLPDADTNGNWLTSFYETIPRSDIIFTHNPLVEALFQDETPTGKPPAFSMRKYSGTNVRKRMVRGGDWKSLVPPTTAEVIEEVNGVERVRLLSKA